jgi:DNA repair ATPase RecN
MSEQEKSLGQIAHDATNEFLGPLGLPHLAWADLRAASKECREFSANAVASHVRAEQQERINGLENFNNKLVSNNTELHEKIAALEAELAAMKDAREIAAKVQSKEVEPSKRIDFWAKEIDRVREDDAKRIAELEAAQTKVNEAQTILAEYQQGKIGGSEAFFRFYNLFDLTKARAALQNGGGNNV